MTFFISISHAITNSLVSYWIYWQSGYIDAFLTNTSKIISHVITNSLNSYWIYRQSGYIDAFLMNTSKITESIPLSYLPYTSDLHLSGPGVLVHIYPSWCPHLSDISLLSLGFSSTETDRNICILHQSNNTILKLFLYLVNQSFC